MQSDKILYRQLRELDCQQLWQREIPNFDRASPRERVQRVSLIRAVGVVFAADGTAEQRQAVRIWLRRLLNDTEEKVRRYAMAALPKLGAGEGEEVELISLLESSTGERERRSLGRALTQIGGEATLALVTQSPGLIPQAEQKLRANVARRRDPSSICLDTRLTGFADLRILLHCRRGLEGILRDEVNETIARQGRFRLGSIHESQVTLFPSEPFSLGDLYSLRCFATAGFVLGAFPDANEGEMTAAVAGAIVSPAARDIFRTLTRGSVRYRLNFVGRNPPVDGGAAIIHRAYSIDSTILNDARNAPWSIDVHSVPGGRRVELRPKLVPDPRLYYRIGDVAAASHPPLAAAMARLAGPRTDEIVWDPFCGSGLELIERALLGGVRKVIGTDLSGEAIAIARTNLAAAKIGAVESEFAMCDFRNHSRVPSLGQRSVSLIVTNPPMGRRIRVVSLGGQISDLFAVAAKVLRPGGRLVFANPTKVAPADSTLRLRHRQNVDMGGFTCALEMFEKVVT